MTTADFYRRRLPHCRASESTYFVTWRLHPGQRALEPLERTQVRDALEHFNGQRYLLEAYVVMDDHVHVLVAPSEGRNLEDIIKSWKSFTAHEMRQSSGRPAPVWQEEYFDRVVRDEAELLEKATYILNNPAKRWPGTQNYPWAWALGISAPAASG